MHLFELGGIAIGALALFIVLKHGGAGAGTAPIALPGVPQASPNYLTFNQAQPGTGAQNSLGLSAVAAGTPAATLAATSNASPCACGNAPVQYANLQAYSDYLAATNESIVNAYQASIDASIPSWLGQFINNTFAPEASAAAAGQFAQLAGQ